MANSKEIRTMDEFKEIQEESKTKLVLLCKFSPICPISKRAESEYNKFLIEAPSEIAYYHIDVINSRATARSLVDDVKVAHESPQALLMKDGICIWNASHQSLTKDTFIKEVCLTQN